MSNPPMGGAWVIDPATGEYVPEHEVRQPLDAAAPEKKPRKPADTQTDEVNP